MENNPSRENNTSEETEQRLRKIVRAALSGPPTRLKDIPKRNGKPRASRVKAAIHMSGSKFRPARWTGIGVPMPQPDRKDMPPAEQAEECRERARNALVLAVMATTSAARQEQECIAECWLTLAVAAELRLGV
jgi:hypothetical protein